MYKICLKDCYFENVLSLINYAQKRRPSSKPLILNVDSSMLVFASMSFIFSYQTINELYLSIHSSNHCIITDDIAFKISYKII